MRSTTILRHLAAGLVLVASTLPAGADDGSYGYYRVIEGSADVLRQDGTEAAQENAPLLSGDRLWTGRGSRADVVLPDGTIVRVGGDTEITFDQLARSSDRAAGGTLLYLARGEVQVVTDETAGVAEYPRVDTPNATVYIEGAGAYRIEAGNAISGVVVRRGDAELVTQGGSTPVREGQEAWAQGSARPGVRTAGVQSGLERWGYTLEADYRQAHVEPAVDRSLAYSSSRMDGYGSWVSVESRRAWRPRVGADWSPYRHGRWQYTPSGLTWVSYEPWGWVPYHYGSWDYAPGWGWVWYPGRSYAPAWVYWYWGPSHVGWVPIGYYYRHYGPRHYGGWGWDVGFRFGIHGWAGGRIGYWDRWNFVDCRNFGDRRLSHYTRYAHQLGIGELPRGVIATDTRPLRTAIATRPAEGMRTLAGHPTRAGGRELPDVTRFIARDPGVPAEEVRRALPVERAIGTRSADGGRGGAIGTDAGSPRVMPGRPTATRPGGDAGGAVGVAPGRPGGAIGTDTRAPRARPRSDGEGGGDSERVRARPAPPARSTPGDGGSVGVAPEGRGGVRVVPSRPSEGQPAGRDGATARPSSPTRVAPPPTGGMAGARPTSPTRSAPERPQARPADRDDGVAPQPDDSPRTRSGVVTTPRATPRAYQPPPAGNRPGVTSARPPAATRGDDGSRQPIGRTGVVSRTPPPATRGEGERRQPAHAGGDPGGVTQRAVPPVRRVVEGVRSSRPAGSSGTYNAPPTSRPPASGVTRAPSGGTGAPRYVPSSPPSGSRGGSAPPAASSAPRAPSRPAAASPPPPERSRQAAPADRGSRSRSEGSRGNDGGGGGRGRARSSGGGN